MPREGQGSKRDRMDLLSCLFLSLGMTGMARGACLAGGLIVEASRTRLDAGAAIRPVLRRVNRAVAARLVNKNSMPYG